MNRLRRSLSRSPRRPLAGSKSKLTSRRSFVETNALRNAETKLSGFGTARPFATHASRGSSARVLLQNELICKKAGKSTREVLPDRPAVRDHCHRLPSPCGETYPPGGILTERNTLKNDRQIKALRGGQSVGRSRERHIRYRRAYRPRT